MWICIIIACIPTLAPILKIYVSPLLSKISMPRSSEGSDSTQKQKSIVTFGRLGGRRRKQYTTILYGSQDHITRNGDPEAQDTRTTEPNTQSDTVLRHDAFTTTSVTTAPTYEGQELQVLQKPMGIHVRQDIDSYQSLRAEGNHQASGYSR